MNLALTPSELAFRDEARAWLDQNVPRGLGSGDTREGFARHLAWEKQLYEARWAVVSWPRRYGGREASLYEWLLFEEEYYRARAPQRVTQNGIFLLAPSLFAFGTPEQQERLLGPMASADVLWAQAWSEPGAGSDLAATRSTATRVDGGWRLSGQKTWCTRGAFCDWIYGLFRTDPASTRHHGLTYFLVPLHAPGITVRGVEKLDGDEGFAEVFLEDVFVPDADVLGRVGEGWKVAMATTGSERGLTLRSPGRFMATASRLLEAWRARGRPEEHADAAIDAFIDADAYRCITANTVTRMLAGEKLGAESSVNKIAWSEMDIRMHTAALDLLGPEAELAAHEPGSDAEGWLRGWIFALAGPIYAGTNEIQRNVVAERVLGLPKGA